MAVLLYHSFIGRHAGWVDVAFENPGICSTHLSNISSATVFRGEVGYTSHTSLVHQPPSG